MNLGALIATAMNAVPPELRAPVTATLKAPGVHSSSTGTFTGPTKTIVTGRASQDKAHPIRYERLKLTEKDIQTLVWIPDTVNEKPPLDAKVTWGGKEYTIKNVESVAPDGSGVAYMVDIAR